MATLNIRDAAGEDVPRLPSPLHENVYDSTGRLVGSSRGTARMKARAATYDRKPGPDILHEDVSHLEGLVRPADVPRMEVKKRAAGRPRKAK